MSPPDLLKLCNESIQSMVDFGATEDMASIVVVTPRGWKAPPKFPRGRIYQVKENDDRIRAFSAVRVRDWLQTNGVAA